MMKIPKKPLDRTDPNFKKAIKAWLIHFRILEEDYIEPEEQTMQTTTKEFQHVLMEEFKEEATKKGRVDLTTIFLAWVITKHLGINGNVKQQREWKQIVNEDNEKHLMYDIAEFASLFVAGMLREGLAYDFKK